MRTYRSMQVRRKKGGQWVPQKEVGWKGRQLHCECQTWRRKDVESIKASRKHNGGAICERQS